MSAVDQSALRRGPAPGFSRLEMERIRQDFPILQQPMRGKPLVFLDSAASAQKPAVVIDTVSHFYSRDYANIHRGVYELSERATLAYEGARGKVQRFLGARSPNEIVFLRGTTEAINLVAHGYGRRHVSEGDEILITGMEHHSNIVPWQLLCEERSARLRVAPIGDDGALLLDEFERLLSERTRIVAVPHVSNALGTLNPVREIVDLAHARGVPVLVDGAQAAPRLPVNVRELDCDFYAFSGHKLYGPTGIGVLWARESHLEAMPPYQGGGEMISEVSFEKTTFKEPPHKFEAGTPHIAGAVGLGAAIDYLSGIGVDRLEAWEGELLAHGTALLEAIPEVRLIGTAPHKAGVLSFVVDGVHPHDVGTILDSDGVAVRAGHHCAQPVMERFGVPATVRASLGLYNLPEDLEALARGLRRAIEMFR